MKNNKLLLNALLTFMFVASAFLAFAPIGRAQTDQSWSEPINLSNSGASINPSIVVDAKGTIHVIWFDELDGYKYTESPDGVVWSPPKKVKFPFSPEGDTKPIFVSGTNEIHVFWQYYDAQVLYYSRSLPSDLDEPSTWTNNTELADGVVKFDVKIGREGNLYIAYVSSKETDLVPPGVNFRRLARGGWSQPISIYSSQYFRSLTSANANIRLGVSEGDAADNIYMVWDDRPQKRIFLAKSINDGREWGEPLQISGPDDYIGLTLPFDVNIGFYNDEPFLLWWVGSPGVRCSLYSQLYMDDANQLDEVSKLRYEISFCPQTSEFIVQKGDFPLLLLNAQDDLSVIAWNGSNWSLIQNQKELTVFENPSTLDGVLFGCAKIASYQEKIYAVGCDTGTGRDIWFRSREGGSFDEWFPPSSAWKTPVQLTSVNERISMLSSVDDGNNNVHAFWIQSSFLDNVGDDTLNYAKWSDSGWSSPMSILEEMGGRPIHFAVSADIPGRLLLAWIDGETGDILFSWANSDRAANPSEWDNPVYISSVSPVVSSPNILADVSGRIIIAYAIPVNEQRGVYFVSSDDAGETWSEPFLLFDALAAGWDMVDQPELSLSGDGRLHVLFKRFSLQGDQRQPAGLYYSQSANGGNTWSEAELVSEQPVSWSRIVAHDGQIIHRLWQEKNGRILSKFHQSSQDGGLSWDNPISIASVTGGVGSPTIDVDRAGNLHLMQLVQNGGVVISHQVWNGSQWNPQESYELSDEALNVTYLLTSSLTSKGDLLAMSLIDYIDPIDGEINELLSTVRSLDVQGPNGISQPALIPTPGLSDVQIEEGQETFLTPTQLSPLTNLNDPSASISRNRNLVGFLFILGALILTVVILKPRVGKK